MRQMSYPDYGNLKLDRPAPGVLRVTISRGPMNSMDFELHRDLGAIWPLIDADTSVNAVIVIGEGRAFSAGGEFDMVERIISDYDFRCRMWKDARGMVLNMIHCSKPIIAGINGAAAGGGLAVALLADISIAGRTAKLLDGHTTLGIAADDHAVLMWPLLCGMAKAKYYLLSNEPLTGEEAERIGLVSLCVDNDKVGEKALEVATRIAAGAPSAMRWTKHALNGWLQSAWPAFEASLAFGILGFSGPEVREGLDALKEKRPPQFNPISNV
ncbi:MAG: enoyl-CoA hydratase/isomerase family protein [Panacagrimonas sp.]